ncbi:2-isopropylmalate synthase [Desulfobotulus sp. H1]|uniref:2-isopropylmalate synthase n=1 Tax=Desulfobotulus pelophilus TaxID=2823377 RepID=A0ABT3N6F7_9BACT|nr:2-isopropylmalate synthase [Desulfobotulus pelophilus]MCW7753043.1 2-isopropylmalate synthase [Desulfobotulus pelophilus]
MNNRVIIFDTTLRDGEQSPGASMNTQEKIRIARRLEELGVDVIEAGFPAASDGDFDAVRRIAASVERVQVAALCRASKGDIDRAWEAIKEAKHPRIHTFLATSELHMKYKLQMDRETVLRKAVEAVRYAKTLTDNVEFSAEDGSRSDRDFLCRVFAAVIEAGATTVNLPDTVGYAVPEEYAALVRYVMTRTPGMDKAVLSVHCHNDLGLATANTLAALAAGARQAEVTINGIGERAGNTALEEVVMAINTRKNVFGLETGIDTTKIYPVSRTVREITGMIVQPNKAIVGANAFAHESGIHQDGVLKNPMTYEIMQPETVGLAKNNLVLGKHSGRAAIRARLEAMGYTLEPDQINVIFTQFKDLADKKKSIQDEDLEALVTENVLRANDLFEVGDVQISCGNTFHPMAGVTIRREGVLLGPVFTSGNGPIDAVLNAIMQLTGMCPELLRFTVSAITGGTDAQGEVTVRIKEGDRVAMGRGADLDIVTASARAFVNGLNRLVAMKNNPDRSMESI